jgi:DNA repair ATPase RecN
VVNAKKNAKVVGNKIKIDPVMMAMMEERIRQRVEEEKRKLESEMRPTQEAPALCPAEIKELEEYRKRFAELEEKTASLVRP